MLDKLFIVTALLFGRTVVQVDVYHRAVAYINSYPGGRWQFTRAYLPGKPGWDDKTFVSLEDAVARFLRYGRREGEFWVVRR